jgi:hypothetical protein
MNRSNENRLRQKADDHGYRLQKARAIRWEGTDWTPPYRLVDTDTGFAVWPGFDSLADVEAWLST